ncbi:hypothetical protein AGOR_G00046980 [Albula goreensis]|uniref:Mesoderm induction early response protein 3 n=1 Tax=Albula goreensis TaxID=1534307 RepID=A0A8T3DSP9_9TELE|nr:hypothetical protein AGOR_G00046980 [Albula goreensis]
MAEASFGSSSPVGSLSSEDHDFDPSAEMLVHDYDDEQTLEDEELQDGEKSFGAEIAVLEKEGNMPLEELLAIYRYEASVSTAAGSSMDSSSVELTDELPDMTLDKEEIAKDLLSGDFEEETQSSADDLTPSVTSHEATDFFPRTLRSNTIYDGDKESEGEDEGTAPEDSRKEIMVGSQYQAEVPSHLCSYGENEKVYEDEDQLLWRPGVLAETKVRDFLWEASLRTADGKTAGAAAGAHIRDNEQALYELLKSNYNTHDALERYRSNAKSSKEERLPWTEEECRNFEHALQIYDKNFHLIQKHKVRSRSVAECVAFYYMWKKSERFDHFVQQTRFGKKKYSSYPGVTDLMDRLVDEAEGLAVDGGASVCSGGVGSRMEGSAEQQLSLLNSITASDLTDEQAHRYSALSSGVATVCSPADAYGFPPLESLHQGALGRGEGLGFAPNGEADCLNMLDAGFYHSDLRGGKARDRTPRRLKMGLAEPFANDVSVNDLGVDFQPRGHAHRITGAKMAVSVTDFSEPNGFLNSRPLHQQHAALQSD